MLQLLFSDWIVRFFLLYLLFVGSLTIIRRQRPQLSLPFDLLVLNALNDRWRVQAMPFADLRGKWLGAKGGRINYRQPSESSVWKKADGDELGYA